MRVELVSITKPVKADLLSMTAEEYITYIARISNPSNQLNTDTAPKLLKYCITNGHWSIFEMVDFTVEIQTSRGIAPQILRHRSASFQEYSLRYAVATEFEDIELRLQGKNKQGGAEIVENDDFSKLMDEHCSKSKELYNKLLDGGVSHETARMILPMCTTTRLYMKNNIRNWLAYLNQRLHEHAQKEHRLIAEGIRDIFIQQFPIISSCFDNFENAYYEKFM